MADLFLQVQQLLPHVFDSVFVIDRLYASTVVIILSRFTFTVEQRRKKQSKGFKKWRKKDNDAKCEKQRMDGSNDGSLSLDLISLPTPSHLILSYPIPSHPI